MYVDIVCGRSIGQTKVKLSMPLNYYTVFLTLLVHITAHVLARSE